MLFSFPLGAANSCTIKVAKKPFSTSVFKGYVPQELTHLASTQTPRFSTHRKIKKRLRHPFSGLVHSVGELLHTPWRISTSMITVLLHLIQALGASLIASSAYQKWPTRSSLFIMRKLQLRYYPMLRIGSLRIGQWNVPLGPLIIISTSSFENNQLIGFSISLSPLNVIEMNDLHVSINSILHQAFTRLQSHHA
ncbi:hypothetical protein [Plasmodium yoelii yoelii]|uniref:Uncharacterized protein n=1 Tax=Plasmodium yoelii yoelii TaxID=73239 RepID=Q7RN94_PLAYO|nr:hypothetical protein [Plasmodium yoelii yoelii]